MILNKQNKTIHCFLCNKNYSLDPFEVFINILYEGSITCPLDHLIGNVDDEEWQELYYLCNYYYKYHGKGQCRCIIEETNCNGDEEKCENKLGKESYEND